MKKLSSILICTLILAALFLCGCSKSKDAADSYYSGPMPAEAPYDSSEAINDSPATINVGVPAGRKVIRNADLTVEALEFDDFLVNLRTKLQQLDGYVQSNYVDSSDYSRGVLRSATMVVRVPAEKLDEFLADVNGAGNVIRQEETSEDVTESYVDLEARLASLRTEYDTLLELLENSDNLNDIITIQDRLSNVRYQIESYEAQKRSYDSQIDYSTVTLRVIEVERETVVTEESFGSATSRRFKESLSEVGRGFKNFAQWFIGNLPHIVVFLLFVGLSVFIPLFCVKKAKQRHRKQAAAQQSAQPGAND